jgi:hypothetical protein
MTLIVTVDTANRVFQASERRLTHLDDRIADDEAHEAICGVCPDSKFTLTCTGLPEIDTRRKRANEWLVE